MKWSCTAEELVTTLRAGGIKVSHVQPWMGLRPLHIPEDCLCGGKQELRYDPEENKDGFGFVTAICSRKCFITFTGWWMPLPKDPKA